MKDILINVPRFLTPETCIKFIEFINKFEGDAVYTFNFEQVFTLEPFALLYLSYNLRQFVKNRPNSVVLCEKIEHMKYVGHMGFFRAFGVDFGKFPGEAKGSTTYIPITIINSAECVNEIALKNSTIGDYFTDKAKNMSSILCRSNEGNLFETMSYSLRELLRNILEHSKCEKFAFCAQYWPTKNKVSLCVMDTGIGIKNTLVRNPYLSLSTDLDALQHSLMPGVSGKMYKGKKSNPDDVWENSGYGLYMTSGISKMAGSFIIMSGENCIYLTGDREQIYDCSFAGTLVNMTFSTEKISELSLMLKNLGSIKPIPKPSKSSLNL